MCSANIDKTKLQHVNVFIFPKYANVVNYKRKIVSWQAHLSHEVIANTISNCGGLNENGPSKNPAARELWIPRNPKG